MKKGLQKKVEEYCKQNRLLPWHAKVVVGVSGGPDSVCLLRVLCHMRKTHGITVYVVHVNHGLREAASEDEQFVEKLCREWEVPFRSYSYDVADEAKIRGMSIEEAGRAVRYEAYEMTRKYFGASRVALAHHMDDQVETILWNLFRGSGAKGLTGMAPKRDRIIRPLLCVSRNEIAEYLEQEGLPFREDETNIDDTYTRNRLRNRLIPTIEEEYNKQGRKHIVNAGTVIAQMEDYIERQGLKAYERCTRGMSKRSIQIKEKAISKEEPILKDFILRHALCEIAGSSQDIGQVHVQILSDLMENQVGKEAVLPYSIRAIRNYEGVQLRKINWADPSDIIEQKSTVTGSAQKDYLKHFDFREIKLEDADAWKQYTEEKPYTKCFDYDIIKGDLSARTRLPGDFIVIDEDGSTQKLKYYFINEKIPREERDKLILLAEGSQILWVVGHRIGANYKVTEKTKRVLKVTLRK